MFLNELHLLFYFSYYQQFKILFYVCFLYCKMNFYLRGNFIFFNAHFNHSLFCQIIDVGIFIFFFFIKVHLGTEARIQDILALFYHWHNLPYPRQKMGGWVLPFFVNGYCSFCSKGMISKLQLLYSSYFFVKTLLYSILLW